MPNKDIIKFQTSYNNQVTQQTYGYLSNEGETSSISGKECELFLNKLLNLNNKNEIYDVAEVEYIQKYLQKFNSSIEDLNKTINNINKVEEMKNRIKNTYPQTDGHIKSVEIKYMTNAAHNIIFESNGQKEKLSFSYLMSNNCKKKYKNLSIKEFVKKREHKKIYSSKLEELESEIPLLKGHIKLGKSKTNSNFSDFYVYIYKDISAENERDCSTLLKNKEEYKNLNFDEVYSLLTKSRRPKGYYLREYILSLVPKTEKNKIEFIEVTGIKPKKEIKIKLKNKEEIFVARLETLRQRKLKSKKYNSIEELFSFEFGPIIKNDEYYLSKYVLSLVPISERERIDSFEVVKNRTSKTIKIKLKNQKDFFVLFIMGIKMEKTK